MKSFLFSLLFLLSPIAEAHNQELAVIAGSPNLKNEFVSNILKDRLTFVDSSGSDIEKFSDGIFYFAWRNHVESAVSVEILYKDGSADSTSLAAGIVAAGSRAAIALIPVGPITDEYCQIMAEHPDTVFMAGLGSDGVRFDDSKMASCYSSNILFVAGLNEDLTDLNANQSWGELARVAVPYAGLKSPVDGRSSRSIGMAVAAGKMAQLMRADNRLHGAALIEKFLAESTVVLPSLQGKIAGARALVEFER